MKQNIGTTDSYVRLGLAALVIVLYFTNVISGTVALVGLALAAVLTLTAFVRFCPLYLPFGLSTKKDKK